MLRRLMQQSATYGLAGALPRIASLILVPVLTRVMAPSEYGIVGICGIIASLAATFMAFGMNGTLARFYQMPGDPVDRRRMVFTVVVTVLALGAAVTALTLAVGPLVFPILGDSAGFTFYPYAAIAVVSTYVNLPTSLAQSLCYARQRASVYTMLQFGSVALMTAFVLILTVGFRGGALGQITGQLIAAVCMLPVGALVLWPHLGKHFSREWMRRALHFGWPLVPHVLFGWALTLSDRLILNRYTSLAQVGVYSLAYSLSMAVMMVTGALNQAWTPMYYRLAEAKDWVSISRGNTVVSVACAAACVALALFSTEVVTLLAGQAYWGATAFMPILVGAYYLQSVYFVMCTPIFYGLRTRLVPVLSGVAAAANVTLNLLLIPQYGAMVAAWTTLLAYAIMAGAAWVIGARMHPQAFAQWRLLRLLVITALSIAVSVRLESLPAWDLKTLGLKFLLLAAAGGLVLATRVVTVAEVRTVLAAGRRRLRGA